jgi:phage tail-like protein
MHFRVEVDGLEASGAVEILFPEARIARARNGPRVAYGPLVLRRALTRSREWYDWWDSARRPGKAPSLRDLRVVMTDELGRDARAWRFRGVLPVVYQLSPLQALGDGVVIESLELALTDFALDETEIVGRAKRAKARLG